MLNTGDVLNGFKVTRVRENAELNGRMVEMEFEKTGTPLIWIDNGLENKLFCITFRTFPEDSTGVFHILEHSTLCGSDKFRVREPFVELLKGSMQTFLNAMTDTDKTMYPVSSRVDKDFLNLTEVYLDAVFAPRLLDDPNIFYQEGHHTEVGEDGISYKGVVFNEMKGAMSNADRLISQKLAKMMFPEGTYGHNSGGAPECIPDLTYEKFCETYRRFYHPSNSLIFLDGAVPLEKTLALLEEYLSKFEKSTDLPEIKLQQPVGGEGEITFELSREEELENKGRLSFGRIIGSGACDPVTALALETVATAICGTNESPLKRAVLESGLAEDIDLDIDCNYMQQTLEISLTNINDGCEKELTELVFGKIDEILASGIDRDDMTASLALSEFRTREPNEPQGLMRCIGALYSPWLIGGDAMDSITYDKTYASVRRMIEDGGIDELARKVLGDRSNMVKLRAVPSYTAGDEARAAEKARLDAERADMDDAAMAKLVEANAALLTWQQTPDPEEELAKLPKLELSDIGECPPITPTMVSEARGMKRLYHPAACHGIKYINLYFNVNDIPAEEIRLLSYADTFFNVLPTEKYDALTLERMKKRLLGNFAVEPMTTDVNGEPKACRAWLAVHISLLDGNKDEALALVGEILKHTVPDKARMREYILQSNESAKRRAVQAGHRLAMTDASASFSSADHFAGQTDGLTHLHDLHDFVERFDERFEELTRFYGRVMSDVFCRARLTYSVGGECDTDIDALLDMLPDGSGAPDTVMYPLGSPARRGIRIPAQVSFAVRVSTLDECGAQFDGSMAVAANIVSLADLWSKVRVQGGAYGCGLSVRTTGRIAAYSYRDPTPARTLGIYAQCAAFLREFAAQGVVPDNFIISTVAETEPLIGPRDKCDTADVRYLNGRSDEFPKIVRAQMLATDCAALNKCADLLEKWAENGAVTVVGHEGALKDCGEMDIMEA